MNTRAKRVLIAGCGYLGFRCALKWLAEGVQVSAVTRTESRAAELKQHGIEPVVWDMALEDSPANTLPSADIVLWAVGLDRKSNVSRESIWIDGLSRFMGTLASAPARFVYVSSSGVYGQVDGEVVDEHSEAIPSSESGQCCLRAESLVRDRLSTLHSSTSTIVLRMSGLYGPDRLLRRVNDLQNKVPLSGNPDGWLNLVHIDDAARAGAAFFVHRRLAGIGQCRVSGSRYSKAILQPAGGSCVSTTAGFRRREGWFRYDSRRKQEGD